jgi:hypothetical protein
VSSSNKKRSEQSFLGAMAKARQMAAPGPKVADKPKDGGLMVDFYLTRVVDFVVHPAGPRVRFLTGQAPLSSSRQLGCGILERSLVK